MTARHSLSILEYLDSVGVRHLDTVPTVFSAHLWLICLIHAPTISVLVSHWRIVVVLGSVIVNDYLCLVQFCFYFFKGFLMVLLHKKGIFFFHSSQIGAVICDNFPENLLRHAIIHINI